VQHAVGDPNWVPEVLRPAAVARFARLAEESGYDALAFTDHPAPPGRWVDSGGEGVADPLVSLAFCAAVTTRIRLLTLVLVPPFRNPFLAAHAIATLDVLSEGRVTLGLGTGYLRSELRALGADLDGRRELFDEVVATMLRAWEGDVSMRGASFEARDTRVLPPVVQRPHPPLWLHGNGRWGLERAARYGQGWIGLLTGGHSVSVLRTEPMPDMATMAQRIDMLRTAVTDAGRRVEDVAIVAAGVWPMLDVRRGFTVEAFRDDVGRLEEIGADWVVFNVCGDDVGAAEETLRAFAEQVIGPRGERQ
jgi:probable F420-dependent oxidoreductase